MIRPSMTAARLGRALDLTAAYTGVDVWQLTGRSRTQPVARARHTLCAALVDATAARLADIGQALGGRDHTTIIHAAQVGRTLVSVDDWYRNLYSQLVDQLRGADMPMGYEASMQAAFFQWVDTVKGRVPDLAYCAHWPNGEYRDKATAVKLQAMGVRRGPLDVWLYVRRGRHVGMAFDFKSPSGKLTPEQIDWVAHLRGQGWYVATFTNWVIAAREVADYLGVAWDTVGLDTTTP